MENIPMKVETKMLAFNDSIATANDRVTGETTIIALWSTAIKNGKGGTRDNSADVTIRKGAFFLDKLFVPN